MVHLSILIINGNLYVLTKVNVDTASGSRSEEGMGHELSISGLKDPHAFKRLVWAMKRGENPDGTSTKNLDQSLSNMTMDRDGGVNARTVELLSSIDRRMAEQNDILRQIANK